MSQGRYIYQKLNSQYREIRTVTLKAGYYCEELACLLEVVSLNDVPQYEALSYVWGPTNGAQNIYVNTKTIAVTKYLENALRYLRSPTADRVLWIDAICINQEDIPERNSQVAIMGDIYCSAESVLVWLGEADAESDLSFDLIPKIDINSIGSQEASTVWRFFCNTTQRPYMSRVWVIQEFALAKKDPVVLCGQKQTMWSTFMSAYKSLALDFFTQIDMVKEEASGQPPMVLAKLRYDLFDELRTNITQDGGADLRQLFIMSRSFQCTEPRDRIYGILSMLRNDDRKHFVVDYNKSVAMIYAEALALIFKQGDGPFFLAGLWCPSKSNPLISNLPSWVPDFTRQTAELAKPIPSPISFWPASPRSASGVGAGANNGKVLDDLQTLKVEVLPVDVIDDVLRFEDTVDKCIQQLEEVEKHATGAKTRTIGDDELRPFIEKFRSSEPLWRTLISNKSRRSGYMTAPASYEVTYNDIRSQQPGCSSPNSATVSEYYQALETHLPSRTLFVTKCGFIGIGMPAVQKGDEVTIWFGATVPFVTRPSPKDRTRCTLIGAAYVAGIMEGEMVDELYCEDLLHSKTFFVT